MMGLTTTMGGFKGLRTVLGQALLASTVLLPGPVAPPEVLPNPIASTSAIPNEFNGVTSLGEANTHVGATTHHVVMEDVDNDTFQIWYPNFGATAGRGEWHLNADATGKCSIRWTNSLGQEVITVLTGENGNPEVLARSNGFFKFYGKGVRPLVGSHIYPTFFGIFPRGGLVSHGKADYANGDGLQYGTTLEDRTGTATPYGNTWTGGGDYYGPALIGMIGAKRQTVANDSDSREAGVLGGGGFNAADDLFGSHGEFNRLLQPYMAVLDISIPGATAKEMADPSKTQNRDILARCCSVHAYGHGVNDMIFNAETPAMVQANAETRIARIGAKAVIYKTISPAVTDQNTNTPFNPGRDANRLVENARRLTLPKTFDAARGIENPGAPGTVKDLKMTLDGVHNSPYGDKSAVIGSGYDVIAAFPGVTRINAGHQFSAGAVYQSLDLAAFSAVNASISRRAIYSPEHKHSGLIIKEGTGSSNWAVLAVAPVALAEKTFVFTIFAKRVTGARNLFFQIQKNGENYADARIAVNLGNGAVNYATGEADGTQTVVKTAVTAGEDWYKVELTVAYIETMPANPYVFVKMCDAAFADTYVGDGSSSIAVWGIDIRQKVAEFAFPAKGAKFHLDFASSQMFGGVQPDDTTNANDGRFFRQIVTPALPMYAENKDGSLRRWASGTPFKRTDRGLLVEPAVDYTTRCLYSNDLTNAVWARDGINVTKDQVSRSGVAASASRITATKDGATIKQATTFAAATQTMYADIRRGAGTGKLFMSIDDVTYTEVVLDKPRYNGWGRYKIPAQSVTNPVYSFRIEKSGDAFDIAFITSDTLPFETSPFDTAAAVRRRPYDRPSSSIQGGTTTSTSSGLMDFLAVANTWGVYMEWDSLKPEHFLFGQILRPFSDGSMRFSTDDTDVKGVYSSPGLVRTTVDRNAPLKNKAVGWCADGVAYLCVNGSEVFSKNVAAGPYTALDHKDLGSNGAGAVNMAGFIQQLVIFDTPPSAAEARLWTAVA